MSHIVDRRKLLEAAHAYTKASVPTPQLMLNLCGALAQMLANDIEGTVKIVLPEGIRITRKPGENN